MLVFRAQHVGPNADGEIAGVHPVDLGVLADHVEHGDQMLEQQVVGPWAKQRGSLRFLPPLEMRPTSIATNPAESREAPPTPQYPSTLKTLWEVP